jgi:hypothetical protein
MPNPFKLLARLLIIGSLILWGGYHFQRNLMEPLLPLVRNTISSVQDDFAIQSLDIAQDSVNETVRLRANLTRPVEIGGRTFYPIGYGTPYTGGFQVTMTIGGIFSYSLLTLIVAVAWPVNTWRSLLQRLAITVPIMLAILLINVAITFPAELWTPIHKQWVPDIPWPLLQWSKILMGGGGLILGLSCGAIAIAVSTPRREAPPVTSSNEPPISLSISP